MRERCTRKPKKNQKIAEKNTDLPEQKETCEWQSLLQVMNGCMAIYRHSRCDDHQPETTPQAEINYSIKNLNIHIPNQHLNREKLQSQTPAQEQIYANVNG